MSLKTLATGAILFTAGLASPAFALSMSEAMAKAVTTHPEGLAAEKMQSAIGHQIRMAKAGWYPKIDLTAGTGYEQSINPSTRFRAGRGNDADEDDRDLWRNESRLTISQNVYDFGRTSARVSQQKNRFESAAYYVADVKNQVALRAAESYLNVLRTRELLALAEQNLATHQDYVGKITERSKGGRAPGADVRQAEGRMNLAQSNLEAARGELKRAEADYLEVVGEMPTSPAKEATPFGQVPASTTAAISRAMDMSPVIASAKANIKAANAEKAEAECTFCPRLDAEGGISRNHNLDGTEGVNHDMYAMLYLRQNLYNGGFDTAQVKERDARAAEAVDLLEKQRRLVEETVIKAYTRMDESKNRLEPLNNHVQAASDTRNAYQSQFDLGQRSLLDLLDSEVELYNSKRALIDAKFDVDASVYALLANMGDLVPATVVAAK